MPAWRSKSLIECTEYARAERSGVGRKHARQHGILFGWYFPSTVVDGLPSTVAACLRENGWLKLPWFVVARYLLCARF